MYLNVRIKWLKMTQVYSFLISMVFSQKQAIHQFTESPPFVHGASSHPLWLRSPGPGFRTSRLFGFPDPIEKNNLTSSNIINSDHDCLIFFSQFTLVHQFSLHVLWKVSKKHSQTPRLFSEEKLGSNEAFEFLPVGAVIEDKILCLHGGAEHSGWLPSKDRGLHGHGGTQRNPKNRWFRMENPI